MIQWHSVESRHSLLFLTAAGQISVGDFPTSQRRVVTHFIMRRFAKCTCRKAIHHLYVIPILKATDCSLGARILIDNGIRQLYNIILGRIVYGLSVELFADHN
jgi:hypothetical protein